MGLRDCQAGKVRQLVQFDAFQLLDNGFVPCVVSMYLLKHLLCSSIWRKKHGAAYQAGESHIMPILELAVRLRCAGQKYYQFL